MAARYGRSTPRWLRYQSAARGSDSVQLLLPLDADPLSSAVPRTSVLVGSADVAVEDAQDEVALSGSGRGASDPLLAASSAPLGLLPAPRKQCAVLPGEGSQGGRPILQEPAPPTAEVQTGARLDDARPAACGTRHSDATPPGGRSQGIGVGVGVGGDDKSGHGRRAPAAGEAGQRACDGRADPRAVWRSSARGGDRPAVSGARASPPPVMQRPAPLVTGSAGLPGHHRRTRHLVRAGVPRRLCRPSPDDRFRSDDPATAAERVTVRVSARRPTLPAMVALTSALGLDGSADGALRKYRSAPGMHSTTCAILRTLRCGARRHGCVPERDNVRSPRGAPCAPRRGRRCAAPSWTPCGRTMSAREVCGGSPTAACAAVTIWQRAGRVKVRTLCAFSRLPSCARELHDVRSTDGSAVRYECGER